MSNSGMNKLVASAALERPSSVYEPIDVGNFHERIPFEQNHSLVDGAGTGKEMDILFVAKQNTVFLSFLSIYTTDGGFINIGSNCEISRMTLPFKNKSTHSFDG